jgi:hypothetical protein
MQGWQQWCAKQFDSLRFSWCSYWSYLHATDDNAYQWTKSSRSRAAIKESKLCQFPFADGRCCRMLRHPGYLCLCLFHARSESQLVETENFGSELAQTIPGDFMTATDINYAMGRLYTAVAQDRIPRQCSRAHRPHHARQHSRSATKFEDWNKMLDATKGLLPAPATPPAPLAAGACQAKPHPPFQRHPNPSFRAKRGISLRL